VKSKQNLDLSKFLESDDMSKVSRVDYDRFKVAQTPVKKFKVLSKNWNTSSGVLKNRIRRKIRSPNGTTRVKKSPKASGLYMDKYTSARQVLDQNVTKNPSKIDKRDFSAYMKNVTEKNKRFKKLGVFNPNVLNS
jgi:hypothetical protein